MQSRAATVEEYLASLPDERREAIEAIRKVIRKNIDPAFEEGMQYGMPAYYLPHSKYPAGYHCDPKQPLPFLSVASQKRHIGLYLFCVYCDSEELATFQREWVASGKRLDMGKSCVRVKKLEDVPLDVLGRLLGRISAKRFVDAYEASLAGSGSRHGSARSGTPKSARVRVAKKKTAGRAGARAKATRKKA